MEEFITYQRDDMTEIVVGSNAFQGHANGILNVEHMQEASSRPCMDVLFQQRLIYRLQTAE
jgi:hypothetical protein